MTDLRELAMYPSTSTETELLEKRAIDERQHSGYITGSKAA
jgi:hypothetical protein